MRELVDGYPRGQREAPAPDAGPATRQGGPGIPGRREPGRWPARPAAGGRGRSSSQRPPPDRASKVSVEIASLSALTERRLTAFVVALRR